MAVGHPCTCVTIKGSALMQYCSLSESLQLALNISKTVTTCLQTHVMAASQSATENDRHATMLSVPTAGLERAQMTPSTNDSGEVSLCSKKIIEESKAAIKWVSTGSGVACTVDSDPHPIVGRLAIIIQVSATGLLVELCCRVAIQMSATGLLVELCCRVLPQALHAAHAARILGLHRNAAVQRSG